jgi:hypothetical protein
MANPKGMVFMVAQETLDALPLGVNCVQGESLRAWILSDLLDESISDHIRGSELAAAHAFLEAWRMRSMLTRAHPHAPIDEALHCAALDNKVQRDQPFHDEAASFSCIIRERLLVLLDEVERMLLLGGGGRRSRQESTVC